MTGLSLAKMFDTSMVTGDFIESYVFAVPRWAVLAVVSTAAVAGPQGQPSVSVDVKGSRLAMHEF